MRERERKVSAPFSRERRALLRDATTEEPLLLKGSRRVQGINIGANVGERASRVYKGC